MNIKLIEQHLIKKFQSGIFGFSEYGVFLIKKIKNIIERKMTEIEFSEVILPILLDNSYFKQSKRSETFLSEMFTLPIENYALSPTCEESSILFIEPIYENILPKKIFQISRKFRKEIRPRQNLMRCKEFIMKDGYSFHLNREDLDKTYQDVRKIYIEILKILNLNLDKDLFIIKNKPDTQMRSNSSEEFFIKLHTGTEEIGFCNVCKDYYKTSHKHTLSDVYNVVETGHIFKLLDYFSDAMNIKTFHKKQTVLMGCYGIGVTRLLYVLIHKFFDTHNNIWWLPKAVSFRTLYIIIDSHVMLNDQLLETDIKQLIIYLRLNKVFVYMDKQNKNLSDKINKSKILGFYWRLIYKQTINKYILENRNNEQYMCTHINNVKEFLKNNLINVCVF